MFWSASIPARWTTLNTPESTFALIAIRPATSSGFPATNPMRHPVMLKVFDRL